MISVGVGVGIEQGTVLVDQSGATVTEIATFIGRVTDLMGKMSAASIAHRNGGAQVGDALSRVEQAMQQNDAALVEKSVAAAERLKGRAQQRVQPVWPCSRPTRAARRHALRLRATAQTVPIASPSVRAPAKRY